MNRRSFIALISAAVASLFAGLFAKRTLKPVHGFVTTRDVVYMEENMIVVGGRAKVTSAYAVHYDVEEDSCLVIVEEFAKGHPGLETAWRYSHRMLVIEAFTNEAHLQIFPSIG